MTEFETYNEMNETLIEKWYRRAKGLVQRVIGAIMLVVDILQNPSARRPLMYMIIYTLISFAFLIVLPRALAPLSIFATGIVTWVMYIRSHVEDQRDEDADI